MTVKCPLWSVVVVAVLLVATFFALTVTPGSTALLWSTTTPPIAPSVVDCAKSGRPIRSARTARSTAFFIAVIFLISDKGGDDCIGRRGNWNEKRPSDKLSDGLNPNGWSEQSVKRPLPSSCELPRTCPACLSLL